MAKRIEALKLIDANALVNDLIFPTPQFEKAFKELVNDAPTVDAVPVVRCKDCRHWIADGKICYGQTTVGEDESSVITGENDFCSMGERWGERKEDGKTD